MAPGWSDGADLVGWLGGRSALERLARTFYRKLIADDLLGPLLEGVPADHAEQVVRTLAARLRGPGTPSGNRTVGRMLPPGRPMTPAQRRRWSQLLLEAADEACLSVDDEFRFTLALLVGADNTPPSRG